MLAQRDAAACAAAGPRAAWHVGVAAKHRTVYRGRTVTSSMHMEEPASKYPMAPQRKRSLG